MKMTERQLQTSIVRAARTFGWRDASTFHSLHSPKGWPDLVLAKGLRLLIVELKSEKGKVTPEQETWLAWWRTFGMSIDDSNVLARSTSSALPAVPWPSVEVYVWRPDDLEEAYRVLMGEQGAAMS